MTMLAAYHNALRDQGKTLITHIGLVNNVGTELSGGSPAYARLAVTWNNDGDGVMRPSANLEFNAPASSNVAGWRGFSALTVGTNYGGQALTQENFANQGTYTLLAASTSITHQNPA